MPRFPRRRLSRGIYHVYNRGANRKWVLDTDEMKQAFMRLVARYVKTHNIKIYHYCIMGNHFHFAIDGDIAEISAFISVLSSRYTIYYHRHTNSGFGSIWQGRYKSVLVQKQNYLSRLGRYIELNPVRAGIIPASELAQYPWSSAKNYLSGKSDELICVAKHPYHRNIEYRAETAAPRYADYLCIPHEEDVQLFRSEKENIGDEHFLASIAKTIAGRVKLKVGRPRKQSNTTPSPEK